MSILKDNVNLGPGRLRELLKSEFVVAPGVFNGITALLTEKAGFKATYLSVCQLTSGCCKLFPWP